MKASELVVELEEVLVCGAATAHVVLSSGGSHEGLKPPRGSTLQTVLLFGL